MFAHIKKLVAVAGSIIIATNVSATSLYGSSVSLTGYCCEGTSIEDVASNTAQATVSSDIEFPIGSIRSIYDSLYVIPVEIDVLESSVIIRYQREDAFAPGAFNGYIFTFWGAPTFLSASINPSSTFVPLYGAFSEYEIAISSPGSTVNASSFLQIDINLAPVPEPLSAALLTTGIFVLSAYRKGFLGKQPSPNARRSRTDA